MSMMGGIGCNLLKRGSPSFSSHDLGDGILSSMLDDAEDRTDGKMRSRGGVGDTGLFVFCAFASSL
jgi:hypothetical protein